VLQLLESAKWLLAETEKWGEEVKIYVINGPNLDMLGKRPENIYGKVTLEEINKDISSKAVELGIQVEFYQSNHEGELIDIIHKANSEADGIIVNLGAYSHYSIALRDAVEILSIPAVEVHLSNIYAREDFRHISYISPLAAGVICGFGPLGYSLALVAIRDILV